MGGLSQQRKSKQKKKNSILVANSNIVTVSPRTFGKIETVNISNWVIQPPRMLVKLRYQHASIQASAGAAGLSKTWNANGVYDVDPAIASLTIAGFPEWAGLYGANRVIRCKVKGSIANMENFPVYAGLGFIPGSVAANNFRYTSYGNLHCKNLGIMAAKGGQDRREFEASVNIEDLWSFPGSAGDLTFYGTSASNPTSLASFCLGVEAPNNLFTTAGCYYDIMIEFIVEFSQPIRKIQI
jgi:hypothetical protein